LKTIFFVHDSQETPATRQGYLTASGFQVRLMTNGHQLLSALEKEAPALVLLDVFLEGKNGFEVCQDVHLKYRERAFPIVLCTHIYRGRQFRDEALRLGANDYLVLPLAFEDFIDRIGKTLTSYAPGQGETRAA
jgi:DNA-binding response OmpR family regulator